MGFKLFLGLLQKQTTLLFCTLALLLLPIQFAKAETIFSTDSFRVHNASEFISQDIDASTFSNLTLSFEFNATTLDFGPPQDTFTYGYRVAGVDYELGTFLGLAGSSTAEVGIVTTSLPESAEVSGLEIFISVLANSSSASDKVDLKNIQLEGDIKNIVFDICPNIDYIQEILPEGHELDEAGNCVPIAPVPVDVCLNVDGMQEVLPEGMEVDVDGECTDVKVKDSKNKYFKSHFRNRYSFFFPPKIKEECPRGFSKWIDRFDEAYTWKADDVYKAILLVGGPSDNRLNRDRSHMLYIPGPTEVGDKYYRRFHKISYVCVKG